MAIPPPPPPIPLPLPPPLLLPHPPPLPQAPALCHTPFSLAPSPSLPVHAAAARLGRVRDKSHAQTDGKHGPVFQLDPSSSGQSGPSGCVRGTAGKAGTVCVCACDFVLVPFYGIFCICVCSIALICNVLSGHEKGSACAMCASLFSETYNACIHFCVW